jgi:hypothetical protein
MVKHRRSPTPRRTWQPLTPVVRLDGPLPPGVEAWQNDIYRVHVTPILDDPIVTACLSVKRLDDKKLRSWADLQASGPTSSFLMVEAYEVFPAESRLSDRGNLYHLWVLKAGTVCIPGDRVTHLVFPVLR